MAGPIRISVLADGSQARAEMQRTASIGQRVGAGFRKMALPAVAALGAMGAAAYKATQAAAEDEAAQAKLAQTLKTAAGASKEQVAATESWITAQGKALGIADDELRPALAKLATVTGDVGKAQKLAALAMDISAGSGKSLDSVSQGLARALASGSATALAKYGVETKNAAGETKTLSQVTSELASKYAGAASKAADTAAGRQKKLQVQLGDLQEEIGAKLLPVLTKMAEYGLKAVEWIGDNQGLVVALAAAIAGLATTVLLVNAAMKIYAAGSAIVSGVTKAAAAAQWLFNAAMSANPVMLVVIAIAALVAGIVIAYKKSETFRGIVNALWGAIKTAIGWVVNLAGKLGGALVEAVVAVVGKVRDMVTWLRDKAVAAWEALRSKASAVVGAVIDFVQRVIGKVQDLIGWVKDKASDAWTFLKGKAIAAAEAILQPIQPIIDKIQDLVGWVKDKLAGAWNTFKSAATKAINAVRDAVQWVIDKVEALIDKIQSIPGIPGGDVQGNGTLVGGAPRMVLPATPSPAAPAPVQADGAFFAQIERYLRESNYGNQEIIKLLRALPDRSGAAFGKALNGVAAAAYRGR